MISTERSLDLIEFHNVSGPELSPQGTGYLLPRFPAKVRDFQESPGFLMSRESAGVELRFVTDALHCRIFVSGEDREVNVTIYKGDFQFAIHRVPAGKISCISCAPPEIFGMVEGQYLYNGLYAPQVWRLVCDGGALIYHGIESFGSPIRKPEAKEKPSMKWLAYGSSITHANRLGYPHQAARRLKIDVLNKGMSGSCFIEKEVADYLAAECEWDFATFELGGNMRARFTPDQFERRARYLVEKCLSAKPGRPVFLITLFSGSVDFRLDADKNPESQNQKDFRARTREIAKDLASEGVHLIEGDRILKDSSYLGADLVHPRDYGHVLMGESLAEALKPFVVSLEEKL